MLSANNFYSFPEAIDSLALPTQQNWEKWLLHHSSRLMDILEHMMALSAHLHAHNCTSLSIQRMVWSQLLLWPAMRSWTESTPTNQEWCV